jgi:hypothetical protein
MQSPFPGMDPYIEQAPLFEDFHQGLIGEIARALAKAVPPRYLVRKGERPYVVLNEKDGQHKHVFQPDVGVVATKTAPAPAATKAAELAEANGESISMQAFITEEFRESFVEIYVTEPAREMVTCIEVLSPSNKRRGSEGWDQYLRKRRGLLMGSANLVEIDLLRNGERMPMLDAWPASPYVLLVARRHSAPTCRVWPAYFKRPLPIIPVPLLKPDADVPLNLQPMIEAIYTEFQYDRDIDYTQALAPPLTEEDSRWLADQLRQRSTQISPA